MEPNIDKKKRCRQPPFLIFGVRLCGRQKLSACNQYHDILSYIPVDEIRWINFIIFKLCWLLWYRIGEFQEVSFENVWKVSVEFSRWFLSNYAKLAKAWRETDCKSCEWNLKRELVVGVLPIIPPRNASTACATSALFEDFVRQFRHSNIVYLRVESKRIAWMSPNRDQEAPRWIHWIGVIQSNPHHTNG